MCDSWHNSSRIKTCIILFFGNKHLSLSLSPVLIKFWGKKQQPPPSLSQKQNTTIAPFTLPFEGGDTALILHLLLCVKASETARGEISLWHWSVSGGSIRGAVLANRTSVNGNTPAAHIKGVSVWQSDNQDFPQCMIMPAKHTFPTARRSIVYLGS